MALPIARIVLPTLLMLAFAAPSAKAAYATVNPAESARTYLSIFAGDGVNPDAIGTGHAQSMLDSAQAWTAGSNAIGQWMTINLGALMDVKGVVTQGRGGTNQKVNTFTAKYSQDGSNWVDITGTFNAGDANTKVEANFPAPVQAQYVRIVVQTWSNYISMRAGVLAQAITAATTTTTVAPVATTTTTVAPVATTTTTVAPVATTTTTVAPVATTTTTVAPVATTTTTVAPSNATTTTTTMAPSNATTTTAPTSGACITASTRGVLLALGSAVAITAFGA